VAGRSTESLDLMAKRPVHVATIRSTDDGFEVVSELTPVELRAIGLVSVQWAQLEHSVYFQTLSLAKQTKEAPQADASSFSFSRRLQEFRRLASLASLPAPESRRLIKLCDRIANLEDQRHKLLHALWTWDTDHPNRLTGRGLRPRAKFEISVDVERIDKLASKIGRLLFDIDFPDGPDFESIYPSRSRFARP